MTTEPRGQRDAAPGADAPTRPRRGRPPQRRRVPAALAVAGALLALVVGIAVGYQARGEDPPSGLMTVEREVVTVTVPEPP